MLSCAEGIAGGAVDAEQGDDIAGAGLIDLLHLVGMHPDQTADLDLFAGAGVDNGVALPDHPLIGPDIGQLTVAAVFQLEGQGDQRIVRIVGDRYLRFVVIQIKGRIFDIGRTGKVGIDGIEQRLHPLVLVGRADQDRGELQAQGSFADGVMDHLLAGRAFLEHRLHQLVGKHGNRIKQFLPLLFGFRLQVFGNFLDADIFTLVAVKIDGFHGDQVDHTFQVAFQADGRSAA